MSDRYLNTVLALEDLIVASKEVLYCDHDDPRASALALFELNRKTAVAIALLVEARVPLKDNADQRRWRLLSIARKYWRWRADKHGDEIDALWADSVEMPERDPVLLQGGAQ